MKPLIVWRYHYKVPSAAMTLTITLPSGFRLFEVYGGFVLAGSNALDIDINDTGATSVTSDMFGYANGVGTGHNRTGVNDWLLYSGSITAQTYHWHRMLLAKIGPDAADWALQHGRWGVYEPTTIYGGTTAAYSDGNTAELTTLTYSGSGGGNPILTGSHVTVIGYKIREG